MQQSVKVILSITEIFDNLSETQLDLIAAIGQLDRYNKGDVLIQEAQYSDNFFVIIRGVVTILINPHFVSENQEASEEPLTLAELRQGQVVGEVALVDQGISSATAVVAEDGTQLLCISSQKLMSLCDTYPEMGYRVMKNVAADLAFKIRNTDLTVRQYQLMLAKKSNQDSEEN